MQLCKKRYLSSTLALSIRNLLRVSERENIYCEIHPYNKIPELTDNLKGVILSGSPHSVREENAPIPNLDNIKGKLPLLGVCFGAQHLAHKYGGEVLPSKIREYGRANLSFVDDLHLY